jgi:hypothetical protein
LGHRGSFEEVHMAHYRFYFMNNDQFQRGDDMECADDDAAGVTALTLLEGANGGFDAVEVWSGDRLVGKYAPATIR